MPLLKDPQEIILKTVMQVKKDSALPKAHDTGLRDLLQTP